MFAAMELHVTSVCRWSFGISILEEISDLDNAWERGRGRVL